MKLPQFLVLGTNSPTRWIGPPSPIDSDRSLPSVKAEVDSCLLGTIPMLTEIIQVFEELTCSRLSRTPQRLRVRSANR